MIDVMKYDPINKSNFHESFTLYSYYRQNLNY